MALNTNNISIDICQENYKQTKTCHIKATESNHNAYTSQTPDSTTRSARVGCIHKELETCSKYRPSRWVQLKQPKSLLMPILAVSMAFLFHVGNCSVIGFDMPEIVEYGTCHTPHIEDVDLEEFGGAWYQVQQVPNQYVSVKECIRTKYIYNGTSLLVTTEGLDKFGDLDYQTGVLSKFDPPGPSQTPFLLLTARNVPPVPYYILKANYSDYACIYSCFEVMELKVEVYSILARTPYPTEESLQICKRSFQDNDLSLGKLQPVHHGEECWYSDEGSPRHEGHLEVSENSSENQDTEDDDHEDDRDGKVSKDSKDSPQVVDDSSRLAESENVLLSVFDQIEEEEEGRGTDRKPIKGYKRIILGDDTFVTLNISQKSPSSSGKKKQKHDHRIMNKRKNGQSENQMKELMDTEVTSEYRKDKTVECRNQCQSSSSSSTDTVRHFKTTALTFGLTLVCLTVWH